jgi:hypothetical protein
MHTIADIGRSRGVQNKSEIAVEPVRNVGARVVSVCACDGSYPVQYGHAVTACSVCLGGACRALECAAGARGAARQADSVSGSRWLALLADVRARRALSRARCMNKGQVRDIASQT